MLLVGLLAAGAGPNRPKGAGPPQAKPATGPAVESPGGSAPKSAARRAGEAAVAPYQWKAKEGAPDWVVEAVARHQFYRLANAGSIADVRARIEAAKVARIVPRPAKFNPRTPNIYDEKLGPDGKYTAIYPTKDDRARAIVSLERSLASLSKAAPRLADPKVQPATPQGREPIGPYLEPVEPGK